MMCVLSYILFFPDSFSTMVRDSFFLCHISSLGMLNIAPKIVSDLSFIHLKNICNILAAAEQRVFNLRFDLILFHDQLYFG